jgi:benzoyl-CoA reductase/2-hydroxyglutaryl-CoA dehydratase subunit BcrC/BadD/HgdB
LSYFERNHKEILERFKEKITSKTLEKLFKRIGKNENKFHDLCVLKEEEFFKKYFKLGI